ncbi:hypothetical protein [Oceanobacillus sp. ISL-73]|uniref:hypothetical protein n=1 Tax=Oceanobacillus sp. ISL-73 TaxID=2819161 RepID=UPI001BE862A6|nr:hypothetical protein [Oceanobacillus sp. ISL-73]MBT2598618.1 hypothetical protein [Oceanobacillus sp. ISL-74]MBT2651537.1 hypothetical protein [Oceanobacillus sp. ISL-73]
MGERVVENIKKFYAIALHVYLARVIVILTVVALMGVEAISMAYIWLTIMIFLFISGIDSLILNSK